MADAVDLVDRLSERISIYDGADRYRADIAAVAEPMVMLFAAYWTYGEVMNGGFSQYFANSTGIVAPEAVRGFREIGQTAVADVLQRAMAHFGSVYPREREQRHALMDLVFTAEEYRPDAAFDALDDEFFALVDEENGGFESAANRFAARIAGLG
jgi:Domain of unknown function (DUF4375)